MGRWTPMVRLLVTAVLIAALCGCDDGDGGSGGDGGSSSGTSKTPDTSYPPSDPGGSTEATPRATYQVPAEDCDGWTALTITTDDVAELEYLDDFVACVNPAGDTTYLWNQSDAVWVLGTNLGTPTPVEASLTEQSFVAAVGAATPGQTILVPGAKVSVDRPPEAMEWVIDLNLSFAWQGHDTVVGKLRGTGQAAMLAALKRRSPAGEALAVCTLAVYDYSKTVSKLEDAEPTQVLIDGFGVGASASKCRTRSAAVGAVGEAGQSLTLADDLARLRGQTELLEQIHGKLSYAQTASRLLKFALKASPRG